MLTKTKIAQMLRIGWVILRAVWVTVALLVLILVLDILAYDDKNGGETWLILTWLMLYLSFPAGALVSLGHMIIYIEVSYFSLLVEWYVYFVLGYLQWFVLIPYIFRKILALKGKVKK